MASDLTIGLWVTLLVILMSIIVPNLLFWMSDSRHA